MNVRASTVLILAALLLAPDVLAAPVAGGDREAFANGVALLRKGKPKEALAVLKRAEKSFGDEVPAELVADLALAAQGAGELGDAAVYAERAAALDERFNLLRDTIVGAVHLQEGREAMTSGSPEGIQKAADSAKRAVEAFTRALLEEPKSKRARRNLERALKLQKEIEKQKQQQKQDKKNDDQNKDDKQDKEDNQDKKDEQKQDDQQKQDQQQDQKQDQKQKDQQKQDEKKDPQQDQQQSSKDDEQQDEKKDSSQKNRDENKDQSKQQKSKSDETPEQTPDSSKKPQDGKPEEMRELTPQQMRLLKQKLDEILKEKRRIRVQRAPKPKPGKKDW